MKKTVLLTLLCFSAFISELQAQKRDTIYFDRSWNITTKKLAGYYRVESKVKTADTKYYHFKDFYKENNKLQNEGYFTKKMEMKSENLIGFGTMKMEMLKRKVAIKK